MVLHASTTDGGLGRTTIVALLMLAAGLVLARSGDVESSQLQAATTAATATAPAGRRSAGSDAAGASTCHRLRMPAVLLRAPALDEPGPAEPPRTPGWTDRCPASATGAPNPMSTATPTSSIPPYVTVTATARPDGSYGCPCSVWDDSVLPAIPSQSDARAVEVGVKFQAEVPGFVTGVRFFKGPANTGPHVGKLWTSTGALLASAAFQNETATGWQQTSFDAPVPIAANTTYVMSYYAAAGGYAASEYFFVTEVRNGPLRLLRNGEDGGNGVFAYGGVSQFPTETYNQNNYSIDLVFTTGSSAAR